MPMTEYPVHPLPPKPPRYRAEVHDLSRSARYKLARYHEDRSQWRQAAAYWRTVPSSIDERAALAIACSSELGDAWRDHRAGYPVGSPCGLTYRAFGFRWLLANDCLHDYLAFSAGVDPIRDTSFVQFVVEGMDTSAYEDDVLSALAEATCSLRAVESYAVIVGGVNVTARAALVRMAVDRLHFAGADDLTECARRIEPWVDVAVGLGHTPAECGASRQVVVLDGSEV